MHETSRREKVSDVSDDTEDYVRLTTLTIKIESRLLFGNMCTSHVRLSHSLSRERRKSVKELFNLNDCFNHIMMQSIEYVSTMFIIVQNPCFFLVQINSKKKIFNNTQQKKKD